MYSDRQPSPAAEAGHGAGNPRISVVIPTHGRPDLLRRALETVAAQELPPQEVLVVDDMADASTRSLVEGLAPAFPARLAYLHNDGTAGACGSRNVGLAAAGEPLVAFLDDDDEWHPAFLRKCGGLLAQSAADFVLAQIDRVYPDGRVKKLLPQPGLTAESVLASKGCMTGSSFVARREAVEATGGFDPNVPVFNDWDLFIRLVRGGYRYEVVAEPLVRWMEHGGERISAGTLRRAEGMERFLRTYGPQMDWRIRAYYLRLAYGIRKEFEPSVLGRWRLTLQMMRQAGARGTMTLLARRLLH